MIIVKLIGGLGNQLFQYAIARKLAIHHNVDVLLDISAFREYKLHKYSLDKFAFKKKYATKRDLANWELIPVNFIQRYFFKFKRKILHYTKITEKGFGYDKNLLSKSTRHTYLDGYWQTEKYFSDIRQTLLKDLEITSPLTGKNLKIANLITNTNSVSMHIRRADYVSNSTTLKIHGVCDISYYQRSIDYIAKKIEDPFFFVFSDDIEWAKKNIKISHKIVFVDNNDADTNYEDIRLMSLCKHNIIANSTFSWWGAWLNKNEKKTVIAPKQWFAAKNKDSSDIIPDKWIKL